MNTSRYHMIVGILLVFSGTGATWSAGALVDPNKVLDVSDWLQANHLENMLLLFTNLKRTLNGGSMRLCKLCLVGWISIVTVIGICNTPSFAVESRVDLSQYPSTVLLNEHVKMKVYLPDPEKGVYRATRYDWSGLIESVQYKGHEYFGYWKDAYDPMVGIFGPADTYRTAGLGYDEAKPGESFIRIGVGSVKKEDEPKYDYHNMYTLVDSGKWTVDAGSDWVTFTHRISNKSGYGYVYTKTLRLKDDGFVIHHKLQNTGVKVIETDQYNHNFFMIDHETCGPSLGISYPYPVSTEDDLKGLMEVKGNTLHFTKNWEKGNAFMSLKGYSEKVEDNKFTINNINSGVGVTVTVDKPLTKLEFWTNG